jgi:5'(3')-deoxyribonucleotidase
MKNIYLDMDDVLADFSSAFARQKSKEETWNKILSINEFWENLNICTGAIELVDFAVKNFEFVSILSAVSKEDQRAWGGKVSWIYKHFSYYLDKLSINLVERKNKCRFADSDSLLIDDKKENCDEFWLAGGQSLLHADCITSLEKLKSLIEGRENAKNQLPRRW